MTKPVLPTDLADTLDPATILVRGGATRSPYDETCEALFMTSGFVYDSAAAAEQAFAQDGSRFVYSRYRNPTVAMFEERLRLLEGAEAIMLMRWKDCPEPPQPGMVPPGSEDKVMHMALRIGDTTVLASDGPCQGQQSFQGFALSLTVPDEAEADRTFASLADGGQVQMPLAKTFFSPRFGMVADRFGVSWMVYVAA